MQFLSAAVYLAETACGSVAPVVGISAGHLLESQALPSWHGCFWCKLQCCIFHPKQRDMKRRSLDLQESKQECDRICHSELVMSSVGFIVVPAVGSPLIHCVPLTSSADLGKGKGAGWQESGVGLGDCWAAGIILRPACIRSREGEGNPSIMEVESSSR